MKNIWILALILSTSMYALEKDELYGMWTFEYDGIAVGIYGNELFRYFFPEGDERLTDVVKESRFVAIEFMNDGFAVAENQSGDSVNFIYELYNSKEFPPFDSFIIMKAPSNKDYMIRIDENEDGLNWHYFQYMAETKRGADFTIAYHQGKMSRQE